MRFYLLNKEQKYMLKWYMFFIIILKYFNAYKMLYNYN